MKTLRNKMEYPVNFGLKVSVNIIRDNIKDIAIVQVNAPMYINKQWTMPHSYKSSHFTDNKILNDSDFIRVLSLHYPN